MYDIIIIGAGPAGMTAAIYACMANKKTLIIEKSYPGGQTAEIYNIKNYPGFESISGFELSLKMKEQASKLGAIFKTGEVISCNLNDDIKEIKTHEELFKTKCVIIATGAFARQLEVKNEKSFLGKGLSYCATCDGNFFKDKTVAVVGGGNTSMEDCLYLSNLVKKLYLIHRRETFTAFTSKYNAVKALTENNNGESKVSIITNSVVTSLNGNDKLNSITILNKQTNKEQTLNVDGIFVAIGRVPDTGIFKDKITLSNNGFILTDENMQTNIKGVYAIGDVRNTPLRQIVTACADGAIAVTHFIANKS